MQNGVSPFGFNSGPLSHREYLNRSVWRLRWPLKFNDSRFWRSTERGKPLFFLEESCFLEDEKAMVIVL